MSFRHHLDVELPQPYSPETAPVFLDMAWRLFGGRGFTSGQTIQGTTLTVAPSPGNQTLTVAAGSTFVANEPLFIRGGSAAPYSWTRVTVASVAGNVLTLAGVMSKAFNIGDIVIPAWANDTHPNNQQGYSVLSQFVADAVHEDVNTGVQLFGFGTMASTYTDANGVANMPVGWESIGTITALVAQWNATQPAPHARGGKGGYFSTSASGAGVRTLESIKVPPGGTVVLSAMCKWSAGAPALSIVDKDNPSNVLVGPLSFVSEYKRDDLSVPTVVSFTVPPGVVDIEIRLLATTSATTQLYFGDVRVMNDAAATAGASARPAIARPAGAAPIVVIGDSWAIPTSSGASFAAALAYRMGNNVRVINRAVSGRRLDQMLANWNSEVAIHRPRYVVHMSGFMNDLGSRSQAQIKADVDTLIDNCRSIGATAVILGVAPQESALATALTRNDDVRGRVTAAQP